MQKKALFLQKEHILKEQREELIFLFREYLPGYQPFFTSSAGEVAPGAAFHLVITAFYPFFPDVMKKIGKPEHLHFTSSGTDSLWDIADGLDLDGVAITNSAGVNAVTISEHVMAGILAFAKNLHRYRDQQAKKEWKRHWHIEVSGQNALIIGLGNVGREVARRCSALGLHVTGCDLISPNDPHVERHVDIGELPEVVPQADYVIICVPLTRDTRGMVNHSLLNRFKKTAVLVNVSRGEVAEEEALIHCLRQHRIKGAVLDVFDQEPLPATHPFWGMDQVILTPHVAGTTQHYMRNMFRILRDKLQ